jgi:hypothetical protein
MLVIANVAKKVNGNHVSKCRVFCSAAIIRSPLLTSCYGPRQIKVQKRIIIKETINPLYNWRDFLV